MNNYELKLSGLRERAGGNRVVTRLDERKDADKLRKASNEIQDRKAKANESNDEGQQHSHEKNGELKLSGLCNRVVTRLDEGKDAAKLRNSLAQAESQTEAARRSELGARENKSGGHGGVTRLGHAEEECKDKRRHARTKRTQTGVWKNRD